MRDRGQLSQFHEVSTDRRSWTSASDLRDLFNPAPRSAAPGSSSTDIEPMYELTMEPSSQPIPSQDEPSASWFFARNGTHHGPLFLADLQRMADSRELLPDTLIWKPGMGNWVPALQIPELRFSLSADSAVGFSSGENPYQYQLNLQAPTHTSGLAVASLVLGLIWLCGLGSLLATIFAAIALTQIARSNGRIAGKGMAIAGLVLGIIGLAVLALPVFTSVLSAIVAPFLPHLS
jgi:hypothetical protein